MAGQKNKNKKGRRKTWNMTMRIDIRYCILCSYYGWLRIKLAKSNFKSQPLNIVENYYKRVGGLIASNLNTEAEEVAISNVTTIRGRDGT